ncbi:hypothetical protein C5167_016689 [Papaver somniferum]|nr:hypothetical protein C5167_016689 [Papaver somniferum]
MEFKKLPPSSEQAFSYSFCEKKKGGLWIYLNPTDFLERLRGKRIIFVGDSQNRNMWKSLVCMLRHGVANTSRDYNCSVQYVSAPFLVRETSVKLENGTTLTETLRLDLMHKKSWAFRDADVIVFNTGQWWNYEKTSKGENYYQEGTFVYPKLKVLKAFEKALNTWGNWVDENIDTNRTQVIFRGYSFTHFQGGQWNTGGHCHKETEPNFRKMKTPVIYMNISRLTDYRKDGHPSIYRTEEERVAALHSQDCSHWCLPGVPDVWNQLMYASLLQFGQGPWTKTEY